MALHRSVLSSFARGSARRKLQPSPYVELQQMGLFTSGLQPPSQSQPSPLSGRNSSLPLVHRNPHSTPAIDVRKRALSSYEWKNMNKYTQQSNKDFASLTPEEIRKAGEDEVNKVEKALKAMEPFNDEFTVRRDGLEVFAELGPQVGTYWIKFDLSIQQICMVSPRSGPHRYIYDKESGKWIGEADKHDFQGMLTRDIIQSACGVPDF